MKNSNINDSIHSLSHTKWERKYHIVFAPKYRRKVFFAEKRYEIGRILRELCKWKGVNLISAEACPDHIHILVEIPPKMSISGFMGFLILNDRELTGIMAHEMGHLQKGHTKAGLFIVGMNWFGRVIARVYMIMNVLCRLVSWVPVLGWMVSIIMFFINLQYTVCIFLLQIPACFLMLSGQREEEYEADHYACCIGLGKELEQGLMVLDDYYGSHRMGFLERLQSDHPDTKNRLKRIRKYNEKLNVVLPAHHTQ